MIKLVWRVNPAGLFETQWIHELFAIGGVKYEDVLDLKGEQVIPNAVVVFNHAIDYETYFQNYEDLEVPYGAIHLSDETLTDSTRFYGHRMCKFVYRNYHNPLVLARHKHVVTFGLGYKNGFARTHTEAVARYYNWSFAGNVHTPERVQCLTPFLQFSPYKLHTTNQGFNSASGLSTDEYRNLMDDSKFVICPIGQGNIDSFRVYEALESGAIPIVLAATPMQPYTPSYWHALFPWMKASTIPMVIHNDWNAAAKTVRDILQNKETYLDIQSQLVAFWKDAKKIWGVTLGHYCSSLDSSR